MWAHALLHGINIAFNFTVPGEKMKCGTVMPEIIFFGRFEICSIGYYPFYFLAASPNLSLALKMAVSEISSTVMS